jgi:phage tail tape-measure protein
MALSANQVEILIKARDEATKVVNGTRRAMRKLRSASTTAGRSIVKVFRGITKQVFSLKTAIIGLTGGFGFGALFKSVMQTGAAFENYAATLKIVLGSQEDASKALKWIENFAKRTPYEVENLTEAFVRLAAYGIKGEDVLGTLGDTAAAMGKDIMQAVEAFADAQTGEFERLKEFGIKALQITKSNADKFGASLSQVGQTALAYTDKNGKQMYKIIDRNNRAIISSTLQSIWNEKFAGAMDERSKTIDGMLSNLSDQWTSFEKLISKKVAPLVRAALKRILEAIDQLDKEGTLDKWATSIGNVFKAVIAYSYGALQAVVDFFRKSSKESDISGKDLEDYRRKGQKMANTILNAFDEMKQWLDKNGSQMWDDIKSGASALLEVLRSLASAIESIKRAYNSLKSNGFNLGSGLANLVQKPAVEAAYEAQISGTRATGGGVTAGKSYMVGENGAEVFTPSTSGTVSNQSSGTTVINNIYTSNSRHGVDNALSSRGNMTLRTNRVGLALAGV